MGLLVRRQEGKKAILLPKKKESPLPSAAHSHRAEGLAESPVPVLSGEDVAEALYAAVLASRARGEEVLLASPTVTAYESERLLVRALDEGTAEEVLASLLTQYLEAHRMTQQGEPWTGEDVRLYYVTVKKDGKTLTGYTANRLQVRILSELWKRRSREAELSLITL